MPDRKTYYLVESFASRCNYDNGEVIALTPMASRSLDDNKIPHRIINEFFSEKELRVDVGAHFFDQIQWFKRFDEFLKSNIDYCRANDIDLATAHYNPIKYLVDSFVTYSFILTSFFKAASPANIKFVTSCSASTKDRSLYKVFHPVESFYAQLLPILCGEHGVSLECITDNDTLPDVRKSKKHALKNAIKSILLKLNLKSLQSFIRYKKYSLSRPHKGSLSLTGILFLHTGVYPIDHIVRNALCEGARAFTMSQDLIFHEGRYAQNVALDFKRPVADQFLAAVRRDCENAVSKLKEQNGLLGWINEKCRCDAAALLLPYLDNFISHLCPEDIIKISKLSDFCSAQKIDFIVVRSSSGRDSAVSLAVNNRVKKICFQHSCTAFEQLSLLMSDVYFFDKYVTTDSLSEKYFKLRANNELFDRCKIVQAPHYLESLKRDPLKRERLINDEREVIMYAPNEASIGIYNLNVPTYEPNWYCGYLKEMIDYLGSRQDKVFVFKPRAGRNWAYSVTVPYIKARKFTNIYIEEKPFTSYLHRVDRIILDYPATAFFESAAAGMPTLSLYKANHPVWDGARDFFGPMLQPFMNAKEAISHIDKFLAANKEKYITELPMAQGDIADIFSRAGGQKIIL